MSSTYIAPASWASQPRTLNQAMPYSPLLPSIPSGQTIYFTEITPEGSLRNGRLSNHVGSAATMSFAVNQTALENATTLAVLTRSLLGGYCTLNGKKNTPYKHPFIPGVYAKDIVDCVQIQTETSTDAQVWGNYNICKLTLSFESMPYPVGLSYSPTADYNPNFISWQTLSSNSRVSSPVGWYVFLAGENAGKVSTFGNWLIAPYTNITATIFNCTRQMVYGNTVGTQLPVVAQYCGQVNAAPFAGMAAQKLVLDSVEVQKYHDWLGVELFNVKLNMIYNQWGWNSQPDLTGSIQPIGFLAGGVPPFALADFPNSIFNPLNPR